jgi:hypothetical protein
VYLSRCAYLGTAIAAGIVQDVPLLLIDMQCVVVSIRVPNIDQLCQIPVCLGTALTHISLESRFHSVFCTLL